MTRATRRCIIKVGQCYFEGKGVEQSMQEAARYWRLTADQGHAVVQLTLGGLHNSGMGAEKEFEEAARYWRLAADQGHAEASSSLMDLLSLS